MSRWSSTVHAAQFRTSLAAIACDVRGDVGGSDSRYGCELSGLVGTVSRSFSGASVPPAGVFRCMVGNGGGRFGVSPARTTTGAARGRGGLIGVSSLICLCYRCGSRLVQLPCLGNEQCEATPGGEIGRIEPEPDSAVGP